MTPSQKRRAKRRKNRQPKRSREMRLVHNAGRIFGLRLLTFPLMARVLPRQRLEHIQHNFQKYGVL